MQSQYRYVLGFERIQQRMVFQLVWAALAALPCSVGHEWTICIAILMLYLVKRTAPFSAQLAQPRAIACQWGEGGGGKYNRPMDEYYAQFTNLDGDYRVMLFTLTRL